MNPIKQDVWELNLPVPSDPLKASHLRQPPTWAEFMIEMEPHLRYFMLHYDSPADRLATKPGRRFQLAD